MVHLHQIDPEFRTTTIEEVTTEESGWTIRDTDGWSLYVTNEQCSTPPVAGESVRMFGRGIGYEVRGIEIGGRVYRYKSPTDFEAQTKARDEAFLKEHADKYEAKRAEFDAGVAALPQPLRERIEQFRAHGGDDWRHKFEAYEFFACQQAAAFLDALRTTEALDDFHGMSTAEQFARVPAMSSDHSGNTFGAALGLARGMAERPDLVPMMHGALCPLVGCEAYGCHAHRITKAPV